jgi:transposase-like protein
VTDVTTSQDPESAELSAADEQVLRELTERARTGGVRLTGEGGLLGKLTKMVIEGALEGELDDHLGYGKAQSPTRSGFRRSRCPCGQRVAGRRFPRPQHGSGKAAARCI